MKHENYIIFFEIDRVNIDRYYFNRLNENIDPSRIIVVLEDPKELVLFKKFHPKLRSFIFLDWVKEHAIYYRNSVVFINGNRIPDLLMTKISRKFNCKVVFIQHGMFTGFLKRNYSFYLKKINKTMRYFKYAFLLKKPVELFRIHVLGHKRSLIKESDNLYPDFVSVYSNYWKDWHLKNYFFSNKLNFLYLTNNDSIQEIQEFPNTFIYCYQTLVEDGRIKSSYFFHVMEKIICFANQMNRQLVVKGHPRMSYQSMEFFEQRKIKIVTKGFPVAEVIIGHYSTLLARWAYEGKKIILIELDGHDIPLILKKMSDATIAIDKLTKELIQSMLSLEKSLQDNQLRANYYFNFSNQNSCHSITDILSKIT